jgi:monoamine oxidase
VWAEVSRYGIEIEEFRPPTDIVVLEGDEPRHVGFEGLVQRMAPGMEPLEALAREAFERPHDIGFSAEAARAADSRSLMDELATHDLRQEQLDAVGAFWAAAYQGPLGEGSLSLALRWLALGGWDWGVMLDVISRYKIVGGTRRLVEAIHSESKAPVMFGSEVVGIDTTDSGAMVTLRGGGTLSAHAVVCAVPLHSLAAIDFAPPLPEDTRELVREGHVSRGLKVVMHVQGEPEPYMAIAPPTSPFVLAQYDRALGDGTHLAVAFGPDAHAIDGDEIAAVQTAMRQWFPDLEVLDVAHHSWTKDPTYRGTWAVPRTGQLDKLHTTASICGRIALAGADLSTGSYALIDGAIDSGTRAARVVLAELTSENRTSAVQRAAGARTVASATAAGTGE